LIGFAALCWLSFFIYPIAHSIIVSHYDRLPRASDTFSREDVQREMRDSALIPCTTAACWLSQV